jgi:hypothetical protein
LWGPENIPQVTRPEEEQLVNPQLLKKIALGALLCVVIVCTFGAGHWSSGGTPPRRDAEAGADRPSQDKIPFDLTYVAQKGGWNQLSPREQAWGRAQYLHSLRGLIRICEYRRSSAIALHQGKSVSELNNAMSLLREALARIENDPGADPTLEQPLINDVNIALRKP